MAEVKNVQLSVLPLRDVVIYPHMVIPLFVGRKKSTVALESAMAAGKQVFLVAQKDSKKDDPTFEDLYECGTVSTVLQLLKLPDGTVKVLVEGIYRGKVQEIVPNPNYLLAEIAEIKDQIIPGFDLEALLRSVVSQFEQYVKLNRKIPPEILTSLVGIDDPGRLADTIAAHMTLKLEEKQQLLEAQDVQNRLKLVLAKMQTEIDLLNVEKRIRGRVKGQMEKSQREYYLNEQMKAIQKELGELDDGTPVNEFEELKNKIEKAGMSKEAKEKSLSELSKLKIMPAMAAEATVLRNYLDWMLDVPWKAASKISHDLEKSAAMLDADHYGLEKIKERIIEYLAVQQRVKKAKGPILCLVGPPGVGKTSLGQSIANATGRQFVRVSLGGVRDEAEIRGHRRTYIGSMPGKIIQKMAKVKVRNPLFMLDEVDKMSTDFRGDPSSALLEVLDPEQNNTFNDHYLEVDYDLSDVMFIATANSLDIPAPLLDRMEVIRLAGYTEQEKMMIATRYLIPKQIKENGLKKTEIGITDNVVRDIIRYYTREAGVRNLEREIAKICRKVVKRVQSKPTEKRAVITSKGLEKYLGVKRFRYGLAENQDRVGQVTGLAWTEVGGDLLTIEAAVVPGKGKLTHTGHLGDVMQESIQAALTVVRSRASVLGILENFYENRDIHVHVPEGAIPKDGPSAGVGMCTALVSALTNIPVKANVAMTGEITLRGEVLPIGGLKEKLLAALRGGIETVVIPVENEKDLKEIPKNITQGLILRPVRWIDEVLEIALQRVPVPLSDEATIPSAELVAGKVIKKSTRRKDHPRAH